MTLQSGLKSPLHLVNTLLITLVERPLLDPFAADQTSLRENAQMFACCWRADAEFFRDKETAYAILDEVAVFLRWEMRLRILEPSENLETPIVGDRFCDLS